MHIDSATVRDLPGLRFMDFIPPKEAVAALLTLAPAPDDVLTSVEWEEPGQKGAQTWTLLAMHRGGLVAVTASAPEHVEWGRRRSNVEVKVRAEWLPLTAIRALGLTDVMIYPQEHYDTGDVTGEAAWTLRLEGWDAELRSREEPYKDQDRRGAWFATLQAAVDGPD